MWPRGSAELRQVQLEREAASDLDESRLPALPFPTRRPAALEK